MSDIDRKKAIEILKTKTLRPIPFDNSAESGQEIIDFYEALNMAISSLETDEAYQLEYESTTKSETLISLDVYKQVAGERDIAIEQLHELGYEFGQKIEPTTKNDLVDCNNCKNNLHRGDGTSYCATGDGMCQYECEEPTTKDNLGVDCIDRQATLDAIIKRLGIKNETYLLEAERVIYQQILAMPLVTPQEPRKGHWEHGKELGREYQGRILVDVTYVDWHCSNCNYVIKGTVKPKWNYCPNCGSDNREVEE